MDKPILYSSNMDFEQEQWTSEIAFWKSEITAFNLRLSELITRWSTEEELAQIKHYQHKFSFLGDALEALLETMEQEIRRPVQMASDIQTLDAHSSENHTELRNRMEIQRKIYTKLKKNILKFLER